MFYLWIELNLCLNKNGSNSSNFDYFVSNKKALLKLKTNLTQVLKVKT